MHLLASTAACALVCVWRAALSKSCRHAEVRGARTHSPPPFPASPIGTHAQVLQQADDRAPDRGAFGTRASVRGPAQKWSAFNAHRLLAHAPGAATHVALPPSLSPSRALTNRPSRPPASTRSCCASTTAPRCAGVSLCGAFWIGGRRAGRCSRPHMLWLCVWPSLTDRILLNTPLRS